MKLKRPILKILVLGSALAFTPFIRGDDAKKDEKSPPKRVEGFQPGERIQQLVKELDLTDEQKQKLRPILREQARKLRELRQDDNLDRQERLAKLKEYRQEFLNELKTILTPEQLEKFKQLRSEGPRRRKQE